MAQAAPPINKPDSAGVQKIVSKPIDVYYNYIPVTAKKNKDSLPLLATTLQKSAVPFLKVQGNILYNFSALKSNLFV